MLRLERRLDEEGNDVTFGEDSGNIIFATRDGTIKKTSINDFRNYRKDGIIAINLAEGNELINAVQSNGENHIILVTRNGKSIHFLETDARTQGRNTIGVRGIRLKDDDAVVSLVVAQKDETLLVTSENGLGKRTGFDEYRLQSRGGSGILTMKCTEKTGKVVSAEVVADEDQLRQMTNKGQSVRIRVANIRETGRATQGVKLMTLGKGELIRDIAKVIPGDEDELDEEGGDSEETADASEE